MKKKILDVTGDTPRKKQIGSIDNPSPLKKKAKKASVEKPSKKKKADDAEPRKTKAEKAAESMDKPKKKKVKKGKRSKKSVAELLTADKDQALARIEEHAALAGVVLHPDDLAQIENPEAIFLKTYQRIFKRLQLFRRKMEKTMKKGKAIQSRDVYAYNVLCNQTREVMADMRSLIDMSQMAETLCVEALDPLAKTSAQSVTTMLMTVQSVLRANAPGQLETVMNELKKSGAEIGNELQMQLNTSRNRLYGLLTQSR